jgi:serine/threonine protein phosphatase 1
MTDEEAGVRRERFAGPVAVIGDIHGCSDLLQALLERLGDLLLVVVGDTCDHGPATRGVIDRLVERGAIGVRGNHEEWLTRWAQGSGFDTFALNPVMGGRATLGSYGVMGLSAREIEAEAWRVPEPHRRWLAQLSLALDLEVSGERYWVLHAGVPPHEDQARLKPEQVVPSLVRSRGHHLLWASTRPEQVPWCGGPVIMGHVVCPAPVLLRNVIALDTGAGVLGADGRLSAVVLPERRFVTVDRFDRRR